MGHSYKQDFGSFGEFLVAVYRAGSREGDPREPNDARLEMQSAITGLGTKVPSGGGFLLPENFADNIWTAVYSTGEIIGRCSRQLVTNNRGVSIPAIDESSRATGSRYGGLRTYWADEADTVTATKPKFRSIKLQPNKLMALSYTTEELAADAPAQAAFLERAFTQEAIFEAENQIISGTGAGRPLGVLGSNAVIEIAKESGQAGSTVLAANLKNMAQRLWSASHTNAIWLIGNDAFAQVCDLSFSNGSSVVVYGPTGGKFILGMPLVLSEYTPTLGGAGDVLLGDFSQYLVGEEQPDFLSSIHVRYLNDEQVFKFSWRLDGQPGWSGSITPRNSSITQSPFVVTAERA